MSSSEGVISKKQQEKGCAFCGATKKLTRDHVPPRCIFPKPWPATLITVKSCSKCNFGTTHDDEYFRDMIVMLAGLTGSAKFRPIYDAMLRSFKKPEQKGRTLSFLSIIKDADLVTPSGLYLGSRMFFKPNPTRIDKITSKIVNGLFFHEFGFRLPDSHRVGIICVNGPDGNIPSKYVSFLNEIELGLRYFSPRIVMKDVFVYKVLHIPEEPNNTLWALLFYEKVLFIGVTA